MKQFQPKPLNPFLHPYIFVLKEGTEFQQNCLDYSLLLLQVGQPDTLRSPKQIQKNP